MNKKINFTAAKMIKLITVAAPIVLTILLSFCYIGRYESYYSGYYTCSFYDSLIFNENSSNVLDNYYVTVGAINWILFLPLLLIPILAYVSIFVFKSKISNIICGVGCGLTLGISFLLLIEGICVIVIGGSSLSTLAYIPFIILLLVTATYFILRFVFKKEFKADANDVDVNAQDNNGEASNKSQNNNSAQGTNSQEKTNSAQRSMGMFVVCMFFVPFYLYYWIYKTTEYLNNALPEKKRDQVGALLLCLFIPFYSIYWTYTSAQSIDGYAKQKGVNSDISTLCLITSFLASIIPPILMQQKINEIESVVTQNTTAQTEQTVNTANNNTNTTQVNQTVNTVNNANTTQVNQTVNTVNNANTTQVNQTVNTVNNNSNTVQANQSVYAADNISNSASVDAAEEIKKYKELLDIGAITQEEYEAKKASLLRH
ncbi:MAG: DUF4234 domain-containing protein [Candidatus Coproplasma sp.]